MSTPPGRVCPICGRPAAPRAGNRAFPFCSPRCHQVDLGRWLTEAYVISQPLPPAEDAGPEPAGADEEVD